MTQQVRQALVSVSDKTGILELAGALAKRGIKILSTGGTAKLLRDHGLQVTEVADYTGFPEMLDGRVKTLHPRVHAGILAQRDDPAHMAALDQHDIPPIDLLIVNLYPFRQAVARPDCSFDEAIENIDIGGPAMLRAAAKNHRHVAAVVDPLDYPALLDELQHNDGKLSELTCFELAKKVFAHTASYDGAVANYLTSLTTERSQAEFPDVLTLQFSKAQDMRYGENPHQHAAFYRDASPAAGSLARFKQIQGKELSFNNLADADAAWECVKTFQTCACVIVKHANPCGVALGTDATTAYLKAFQTDPTSSFGGIIALNCVLDEQAAQAISKQFVEVVIAPSVTAQARAVLAVKQNVRVLEIPLENGHNELEIKRVGGGILVQTADDRNLVADELRIVTKKAPTTEQLADLMFTWRVAKFVKSNAIVYGSQQATLGIGAGQMSRVDSARIASIKAQNAGLSLAGSVVASDAFFPFRDGLDVVIDAGATAVIQPGGSVRDEEVIAAADERGVAMVFTGARHFRH